MIRNSKNIKKIKLLYEESAKEAELENKKAVEVKKEEINKDAPKKVDSNEVLNTKYIKRDIIKTAIFFVLALVVLYIAYRYNLFAMIFVK
ncbi:MAG: hypothetical protein WCO33_00365 [bacterium]